MAVDIEKMRKKARSQLSGLWYGNINTVLMRLEQERAINTAIQKENKKLRGALGKILGDCHYPDTCRRDCPACIAWDALE